MLHYFRRGRLGAPLDPPTGLGTNGTDPTADVSGADLIQTIVGGVLLDSPPGDDSPPTFQVVTDGVPPMPWLEPAVGPVEVAFAANPEPATMMTIALAGMVLLEFTSRRRGRRRSSPDENSNLRN